MYWPVKEVTIILNDSKEGTMVLKMHASRVNNILSQAVRSFVFFFLSLFIYLSDEL